MTPHPFARLRSGLRGRTEVAAREAESPGALATEFGGVIEPPAVPPPIPDPRAGRFKFSGSLRERSARGTLINTAFMVGLSVLGLLRGLVLAGFLSRADYGFWGILVISLGTILWLKQIGIGDKYIQQDEPDQEAAFQKAFTLELMVTAGFVALAAAALPLIALLYGVPELLLPGLVVLAAFIASVFQAPLWVYYRRMEFGRQRLLQAIDPVVGFIVSVGLAIAGAGYWAFVIGFTSGVVAATIAAVISAPYKMRIRFERGTLRAYASFSWPLFVASGSALVAAQAAFLAAKWNLGLAATGVIALATVITSFTERVDQLVTGTLYPAICAVKDRASLLYESFVKSNRLALMWAVPFGTALTLFCSDLVTFVLGERWRSAVVVLQVYGIMAAVNHIGFNWTAYLRARAQTRPIAIVSVGATVGFLAVGIPLLLTFGLRGFAMGIAAQTLVGLALRAFYLQRLFNGFSFLGHAVRAFLPTVPAAAVVLLVRALEPSGRTLEYALGELSLYVLVTVAATWYFESNLLREALGYILGRRAATDSYSSAGPVTTPSGS